MIKDQKNYNFTPSLLRKKYVMALVLIAILILSSQILIQISLRANFYSARIINIAGRQRMLSQKITKSALAVLKFTDKNKKAEYIEELSNTLDLWIKSEKALKKGSSELGIRANNSPEIIGMFGKIDKSFYIITNNIKQILDKYNNNDSDIEEYVTTILLQEPIFLQGMDDIVFQYDKETAERLNKIKQLEAIILLIVFGLLLFEALFIFLPVEKEMKRTFLEIQEKEDILDRLASYDEMTGLYNKRMGIILLQQEFEKSKRSNELLTVCFIDADGLKIINDSLGHKIGDEYIKTIANSIQKGLRKSEAAFRYGGDEFVIIICGDIKDAKITMSRILHIIAENDTPQVKHSISTGFAQLKDHNVSSVNELIKIADAEMYKNKNNKRANRK